MDAGGIFAEPEGDELAGDIAIGVFVGGEESSEVVVVSDGDVADALRGGAELVGIAALWFSGEIFGDIVGPFGGGVFAVAVDEGRKQ